MTMTWVIHLKSPRVRRFMGSSNNLMIGVNRRLKRRKIIAEIK
jgi:hypothetical protein